MRPPSLAAQLKAGPAGTPTRPDVAAIEHDRILTAAERYLALAPTPLTSLRSDRSPGTAHDYYSEAEPQSDSAERPAEAKAKAAAPSPFTAHRDAVFTLGLAVPALAAAYLLTGENRYADHAATQLRAWFIDPATRMTPRLDYGQVVPASTGDRVTVQTRPDFEVSPVAHAGGRPEGILETLPLVEIAQAIPFLASSPALTEADQDALDAWFAAYLRWLTESQDSGPRLAALARDRKDHHGSSWLLQAAAYATLTTPAGTAPKSEASALEDLRHRFRAVTLRAQIGSDGSFPHELPSATPYRDSLFNLDMLAAVCMLLSTRFDSVWAYELEDGPSMRSAIAYHFPFIADRTRWPFRADGAHFDQLPGRRASLLFTARAYQRPEYAALWKILPPDPAAPEILRTMPIHQPLLWVRQPARA
jgi:Alginate lyase